MGNDGNLWEVHVGTGPDSFYLPTSWRIVPQLQKKSKKVVRKKTQLKQLLKNEKVEKWKKVEKRWKIGKVASALQGCGESRVRGHWSQVRNSLQLQTLKVDLSSEECL